MTKTIDRPPPTYATILEDATAGASTARVFGLDARERLQRSFAGHGLERIGADRVGALEATDRIVALRASHFYDERIVAAIAGHGGELLLLSSSDGGTEPILVGVAGLAGRVGPWIAALRGGEDPREQARAAGAAILSPTELVPGYDPKLRKRSVPFVLPADPERLREIEGQIFDASYKGVTDFVTKWIWPVPARVVTTWCARRGISPNALTLLSYVLALVAGAAFWQGAFAAGLAAAWLMTFLDTVDGKLARVTLTASRLGDVLDHGLDLVHPPLWWAAWGAGLAGPGVLFGEFDGWVAVVFVGYVVGRLLEGAFILAFGQEMFTWRPFDLAFRLVIARRNPNLVLLTGATLVGRPDLGLIAVGLWTLCCIAVQLVRIAQAAAHRLRGHAIAPYSG